MELRNCPECGRVFTYIRTNLCPACQEKDEKDFRSVRAFLAKHPGSSIMDISKAIGISEEKIMRYIREGRIRFSSPAQATVLQCEVCGKIIQSGRLCPKCSEKLSAGLKKSIMEENKKAIEGASNKPRMHTADYLSKDDDKR